MSKDRPARARAVREPPRDMGEAQRRIGEYLRKIRFKRALFGVSERDVWRKFSEVNELFQQALVAERARYEALLEAQLAPGNRRRDGNGADKEGAVE